MKVLILGALPSSLVNFRGELIKAIVEQNHEVIALASNSSKEDVLAIEKLGAKFIDYPVIRSGLNPLADMQTYRALKSIFAREKPDLILAYTIKPIIWGGLAATAISKNIKFWGLITGLGFAFQKGSFKKNILVRLVSFLYKKALKNSEGVIFQNNDNKELFVKKGVIESNKAHLVNGSGVDTELFKYNPVTDVNNVTFLLIARLLIDKGITEYLNAAKAVKDRYPGSNILLVGPQDPSPNAMSMSVINEYHKKGIIEYCGPTKDVKPFLNRAHVFVLPSYHEGLPRTVIEAMSIGRPVITTLAPGCKDTVTDGVNGFLIPIKEVEPLIEKMVLFIENKRLIEKFGSKSRQLAVSKFDVHNVNSRLIKVMGLTNND